MTNLELEAKWPRAQFEEFKAKGHTHPSDTYEEYLDMRREQEEIAEEGRCLGLTGDEPPELTEEDEAILGRIWEEMGREDKLRCGASELRAIAASMKANAFNGNPRPFSREELHERR